MELRTIDESRRSAYSRARLNAFAERCRAGGLAVTPQRLAIIKALLTATDHPRAERIYETVRKRHPHISLATVHRTLETLCQIGEARKVTLLHDSARYDGNLAPHHHVICVRCRRICDVEVAGFERVLAELEAPAGFTPLGCSLEIQALCERCKKTAASGPAPHRTSSTGRDHASRQIMKQETNP